MSALLKENPFIRNASSHSDGKENENKIKKKKKRTPHSPESRK